MNLEGLIYLGIFFIYIIYIIILLIGLSLASDSINESKPEHITEPTNKPDQKKPKGGLINLFCCRVTGVDHIRPRIMSGLGRSWDTTRTPTFTMLMTLAV